MSNEKLLNFYSLSDFRYLERSNQSQQNGQACSVDDRSDNSLKHITVKTTMEKTTWEMYEYL